LREWLDCLKSLLSSVQIWAEELGWSVRRVDKPMKDSEIGDYRAPGLLLQEEMLRVGLEPIGRATPGAEGIVDLYALPAYDDIARLYYYNNRWHLHYGGPETLAAVSVLDTPSLPLTKKSLREVLEALKKQHAE
jgi:hypothetical protein